MFLDNHSNLDASPRHILRSSHQWTGGYSDFWLRWEEQHESEQLHKYKFFLKTNQKKNVQFAFWTEYTDTELKLIKHNSVIVANNTKTGTKHCLVIKGQDRDPDLVYIGKTTTYQNLWYFPFWELNGISEVDSSTNNTVSIGWDLPKMVPFMEYYAGTFEIHVGDQCDRAPFVKVIPPNEFNKYDPNFNLTLNVTSYDDGKIEFETSKCPALEHGLQPSDIVLNKVFTLPGHYDENQQIQPCAITVKNSVNKKSTELAIPMVHKNTNKPGISFGGRYPAGETGFLGDVYHVWGTVSDEVKVSLMYSWDDGEAKFYQNYTTAPSGSANFNASFPTTGLGPGEHKLRVWAVDTIGQTMSNYAEDRHWYKFTLKYPPAPTLNKLYTSYRRVLPGQKIVIFGEGSDSNDNTNVTVQAMWNDQNAAATDIGSFMPGNTTKPFAFYYTIPENAEAGEKHIYLKAIGKEGSTQMFNVTVSVASANPVPTSIATISDASDSLTSDKPCFNLKYIKDRKESKMSHRDEGFYVAYRLYVNDLYPNETTHYVTKSSGFTDTTDCITVKYFHTTAQTSNYFQANFNVTNNGSFDQFVDLGLFVDSDFGGDNQKIELREDGTGIIVSDEKEGVYYTVLSQYDGSPAFTNFDLAPPVNRQNEDTELDYSSMPFFGQSGYGVRKYYGKDPMYTLSWLKQSIKAGTTVTYTLTFAGYDDIRTPSIIVQTLNPQQDRYDPGTTVHAEFEIIDDNIGETIEWTLTMPNNQVKRGQFNVNKSRYFINQDFELGSGPVFEYTLTVKDTNVQLPTTLSERLHVSSPFNVNFNKLQKTDYFPNSLITLTGSIDGYNAKPVTIKYQFGDNNQVRTFKGGPGTFVETIPIPDELTPSIQSYKILLWAETEDGLVNENGKRSQSFYYTVRDPPTLRTAGFAVKRAYPGQEVIGFAAVNDTQYGRTIEVLVKFGRDGQYEHLPNDSGILHYYGPIKSPFPFLYTIPSNAEVGKVYQVWFKALDPSGLESEPRMQTIVIQPTPK